MAKPKPNPPPPPAASQTSATTNGVAAFAAPPTLSHEIHLPSPAKPGQLIGPFRILAGPVGKGGMGSVFPAEDTTLGRKVALKLVAAESLADGRAVERFAKEARILASLNHPNIVTLYAFGEAEGGVRYLAMEFVEGETLAAVIGRGPVPLATATQYLSALVAALVEAHEKGIVHRDIKPSNILVGDRGAVKLVDFGIATPLFASPVDRLTRTGSVIGTIQYLPPEIFDGVPPGPQTDVYSLGLVLYEMLTGKMPFARTSLAAMLRAIQTEEIAPPSQLAPIPAAWDAFVLTMCAKDPARRFDDLDEVRAALAKLRAAPSLPPLPAKFPTAPSPTPPRAAPAPPAAARPPLAPPPRSVAPPPREESRATRPLWIIAILGLALGLGGTLVLRAMYLRDAADLRKIEAPAATSPPVALETMPVSPIPTSSPVAIPSQPAAPPVAAPSPTPRRRRDARPVVKSAAKKPGPPPSPPSPSEIPMEKRLYDHGVAIFAKGLYRLALDDFRKSRSVNPAFAPAWQYELRTLARLRRFGEARDVATALTKRSAALAQLPEVATALRNSETGTGGVENPGPHPE